MNPKLVINGLVPYYKEKIEKALVDDVDINTTIVAFSVVPQLAHDLKGLKAGIVERLAEEMDLTKTQLNKIVVVKVSEGNNVEAK